MTPEDSDVQKNFELPQISELKGDANKSSVCKSSLDGNHYNLYAATAGDGTEDVKTTQGLTLSSSICPKGWRLPAITEYTKIASLNNNNQNAELLQSPANFTLSGLRCVDAIREGGYYRTSSVGCPYDGDSFPGQYNACNFWLNKTIARQTAWGDSSYYGASIRCIDRQDS